MTGLVSIAFAWATVALGGYDPTQDILSIFGNKCESVYGPSNKVAIDQTIRIRSIIEGMRDDTSCAGIRGALDALDVTARDAMLASERAKNTLRALNEQSHELEVNIILERSRANPNAALISTLELELYNKKIEVLLARSTGSNFDREARLQSIKNFDAYSRQLMTELERGAECALKRPNLIAEVGAQLLALSGNLVSGLAGSIMYATGSIIDRFVVFLRARAYAGDIRALQETALETAVSCAIEGLATTICEARDMGIVAEHAVNERIDLIEHPERLARGHGEGLDIIVRDLPAFLVWAQNVVLGSPVASVTQANERKDAFELETDIRKLNADTRGRLSDTVTRIARGGLTDTQLTSELERLAQDLGDLTLGYTSGGFTQTGQRTKGALGPIFNADLECGPTVFFWDTTSPRRKECTERVPGENCLQCAKRITGRSTPPSTTEALAALDELDSLANAFVATEVGPRRDNNPQLTLSYVKTPGANGRSASDFISAASTFLAQDFEGVRDDGSPIYQNIIAARARFAEIQQILVAPGPNPRDNLVRIRNLIAPEGDPFFIATEFREIVKQSLDRVVRSGQLSPILTQILRLSNSDSLSTLVTQALSAANVLTQTSRAKDIAARNLGVVGHVFAENLQNELLRDSSYNEDSVLTLTERTDRLSHACIRMLLLPDSAVADRAAFKHACENRIVYSPYARVTGLMLHFNELSKKKYSDRVCSLYDFYRANRLFELRERNGLGEHAALRERGR